jgi:hypothetical protein
MRRNSVHGIVVSGFPLEGKSRGADEPNTYFQWYVGRHAVNMLHFRQMSGLTNAELTTGQVSLLCHVNHCAMTGVPSFKSFVASAVFSKRPQRNDQMTPLTGEVYTLGLYPVLFDSISGCLITGCSIGSTYTDYKGCSVSIFPIHDGSRGEGDVQLGLSTSADTFNLMEKFQFNRLTGKFSVVSVKVEVSSMSLIFLVL